MITPRFEIKQDATSITVILKTPYIKSNDAEIHVDGKSFKFYCKPYFLKLFFPGEIADDNNSLAQYDIDQGLFTIKLSKVIEGQYFENLDMLTSLLSTKSGNGTNNPQIEVIGEASENCELNEEEFDMIEEEYNWEIEQELNTETEGFSLGSHCYGFAQKASGVFTQMKGEINDAIEVPSPDEISPAERRKLRMLTEDQKFDAEHFLADHFECDAMSSILQFKPFWECAYEKYMEEYKASIHEEISDIVDIRKSKGFAQYVHKQNKEEPLKFSEEEKEVLLRLPNKEYLLTEKEEQSVLLSLIDILFAYCYDHRTTEGESTTESAWTITRLSATLSWLEDFKSLDTVASTCYHRSLCYPLYRHYDLAAKCWRDVQKLLLLGRRHILKCLLSIYKIFELSEMFHIMNNLYIRDYCVWIQRTMKHKHIKSLSSTIQLTVVEKGDLRYHINELIKAGQLVSDEQLCKPNIQLSSTSESSDLSSSSGESVLDSDDDEEIEVEANQL